MKNKSKSPFFLAFAIIVLFASACTKKFEAINTSPNDPSKVPASNLFGDAIWNTGASFFDVWADMNEPETYAGHLGKKQYIDEARYVYRPGVVNTNWRNIYRIARDLESAKELADQQHLMNLKASALTLQCFIFQIGTDTWRDIPLFNALKGETGGLTPTFDKQEQIYPALLDSLKVAADLFNPTSEQDVLGAGDILFGGDASKWQKFCNSLRLRMAIRISDIVPDVAKGVIEEVVNNPDKYPVMASNDDNAFLHWPGTSPYYEPWYSDYQGRNDHAVSDVLINTLESLDDPRIAVYAKKVSKPGSPLDGTYNGVPIGPSGSVITSNYSNIGPKFREDPAGFSPFMRYAEVLFIEAEAAYKGWKVPLSSEAAYNQGIDASLGENGIDNPSYKNSADVKWKNDVKQIYLQKWISLFKDGHEAWAEERRTDVPLLPAAPGSPYPGHNRPPFRYPYPTDETTLNGANVKPFIANVKDDFWGQQMWWDTRKGVK